MIKRFFTGVTRFSLTYFGLLIIDLSIIVWSSNQFWRFATMPVIALILILYYIFNGNKSKPKKYNFMVIALFCFLIANIMVLLRAEPIALILMSIFFILGDIFYIFKFSNNRDFNFIRLLPTMCLYFIYMLAILQLTLDKLGSLLIPVFIFLFVTLLAVQFALLRKGVVTKESYRLVNIGMVLLLMSHTSAVLSTFYYKFPYQDVVTMLIYAISQYIVVIGIIREKRENKPVLQ